MNPYLQEIYNKQNRSNLPDNLKHKLDVEVEYMENIGIKSPSDHRNFMYITMHLPIIAKDILKRSLNSEELATASNYVFTNLSKFPINTILNFYLAVDNALRKMGISIRKQAYPIEFNSIFVYPSYNINKWLSAMRDIYLKVNNGLERSTAFNLITKNWDKEEMDNFKNWMSFYEEGAHKKYVVAQYSIPFDMLKSHMPTKAIPPDMSDFKEEKPVENKKEVIEDQRSKITARLNAAEKLLCSNLGRTFAGKEFETILEALHNLKRQIQSANKLSISSTLFEDLIVKNASILRNSGFIKGAALFNKVAVDEIPGKEDPYKKLLQGLDIDHNETDDEDENRDPGNDDSDEIVVEAQALPDKLPTPEPNINDKPKNIEHPQSSLQSPGTTNEDYIEEALQKVNLKDVVRKLEVLANIFRNREIARQLSIIDLMMSKLGISSYFPGLGESVRSALESNSYCSTRIDSILSQLRGAIDSPNKDKIDLEGHAPAPEVAGLANSLQAQKDKDEARKAKRKAEEDAEVEAPKPITNAPEQLSAPAKIEPSPIPAPIPR